MSKMKRNDQNGMIQADDIAAVPCDEMLGVFANAFFAWAATSGTVMVRGEDWIACSRGRWITERKPWGKKVQGLSEHQFERMLARGRKKGVLETCQWPSRFEVGSKGWIQDRTACAPDQGI